MKNEQSSLKLKEDEVHLNASSEQRDSPVGKFKQHNCVLKTVSVNTKIT